MSGHVSVLLAEVYLLRLHQHVDLYVLLLTPGLVDVLIAVEVRFLLASGTNVNADPRDRMASLSTAWRLLPGSTLSGLAAPRPEQRRE